MMSHEVIVLQHLQVSSVADVVLEYAVYTYHRQRYCGMFLVADCKSHATVLRGEVLYSIH